MNDLKSVCELTLFLDMHGHSRKPNVFLYGCDTASSTRLHS